MPNGLSEYIVVPEKNYCISVIALFPIFYFNDAKSHLIIAIIAFIAIIALLLQQIFNNANAWSIPIFILPFW